MGLFKEFFARFKRGDVTVEQAITEAKEAVVQEPHARWLVFDVMEDGTRTYSTPILAEALSLKRAYPLRSITQRNVTHTDYLSIRRNG